jgi:hypothetical protein
MTRASSEDPWSEDECRRFLRGRPQLLRKLLADRQSWGRTAIRRDESDPSHLTWVDREGQQQVVLLSQAFRDGHARVLRAVAYELIHLGAEGQHLVEHLFTTHALPGQSPGT